jgi:hypothetical protein
MQKDKIEVSMKNESKSSSPIRTRLTPQYLQKLKDSGFRYVQIKSYSWDHREDYMAPRYFILTPIKDFFNDSLPNEIYESINSRIIKDWSNSTDDEIPVLVSKMLE